MVDLLIDDQSQYCLGFRRGFEDDDGNEIWTGWFRAQGNFEWPSFLTAEELPIHGDHDVNVEIGGSDTLDDIFRGLWKYPDHRHDLVTLERAFLRAVIMFCETLRLFSIWLEVYLRVTEDSKATPLPGLHWRRIRNWKSSCTFVLETASKYHGLIRADIFWRRFHDFLGYESFDAIVTELRLLIWQDFLHDHGKGDVRRWLSRNQPGIEVENHVFPPSTVPEEPAEVQEV